MQMSDMSLLRSRALAKVGAALLLFALTSPVHADRAQPFAVAPSTASGSLRCMAAGDVDGDGRADLIGSTPRDSSLVLLRATSAGRFAASQWLGLLPLGTWANSLDLIDLDGDGHLDLIASTDDSLHVFAGRGDGTFRLPHSSACSTGPLESGTRAWADVNDDGRLDFVVPTTHANGAVLIARGLAVGGFATPDTVWMPNYFTHIRTADANDDGRLDLFVYDTDGNAVSVRIAMVGGAFAPAVTSNIAAVRAVGDQDGNGRADIWSFGSQNARVWRGLGNGAFAPGPLSAPVSLMPFAEPVIADQDGDGRGDLLATAYYFEQGALVLMHSNPDGSLQHRVTWGAGLMPTLFVMGDIDGDGLLDGVIFSRDEAEVQVQLGLGPERFAARTIHSSGVDARNPSAVALADLDRDGRAELLFENTYGNQLTVFHSGPAGRLDYQQDVLTPTYPEGLSVSDLDGDGWLDVGIAGADGPIADQAYSLNQGNGSLGPPIYLDGLTRPSATQVFAGRFDGDNRDDLIFAGAQNPRVAWQNGSAAFAPLDSVSLDGCAVDRLAVGRLDLDSLDDLVFLTGLDSVGVALANGTRGFRLLRRTYVGGQLTDIAVRDLDADGRLDVLALDVASSTVVFLKSLGTGVFAPAVRYAVGAPGTFPASLAIGDLDADGFLDVVVSNARAQGDSRYASATVWYNDHQAGLLDRADFTTGPHGGRLALGDVDGNGTLDLAVANGRGELSGACGAEVSVLLNASFPPPVSVGTPLAAPTAFALPRAWPNPLRHGGELRLDLQTRASGEVVVELLDLQGRRVRQQSYRALDAGRHALMLPSRGIAPGLYFVRATQGSQRATQRVVVL